MKTKVLKNNKKYSKEVEADLDCLLGEISVMEVDEIPNNNINLEGWYAVVDIEGINAYFSDEKEALAYRLFLINRILNT